MTYSVPLVGLFAMYFIPLIVSVFCYKSYLRMRWLPTIAWSCLTALIAGVVVLWRIWTYESQGEIPSDNTIIFHVIPAGLMVYFALPLVVQLHRKWIGDQATERERTPGWEGFKAWLSPGHLVCCLGVLLCGWMMTYPHNNWDKIFGLSILTFPWLWVYPLINTVYFYLSLLFQPKEDRRAAQAKILAMLEEGKIDAQECAELLSALMNSSGAHAPRPEKEKSE
ncbi:MAG: hypothetical protein JXR73_06905 [Candidatus Omnitrophica bacterium]|nr:hypothetical protein [Candidatus Omnitrophota bacterium]